MSLKVKLCLTLLLLTATQTSWAKDYIVDVQHPQASNENPGTAERPLKTIGKAAQLAQAGDTVIVKAGVYREAVRLQNSGKPDAPITFVAEPAGSVVITGADVITGWQKESGDAPIYRVTWNHQFIINHVNGKPVEHHPEDAPRWGRAEQVIADGRQLLPVTSLAELTQAWEEHSKAVKSKKPSPVLQPPVAFLTPFPLSGGDMGSPLAGMFAADTSQKFLYLWLADGSDPNQHRIEASTRSVVFGVNPFESRKGVDFIKVRGFIFRYGATFPQRPAVWLHGRLNQMDECIVEDMAGSGVSVSSAMRRCVVRRCGHTGGGAGGEGFLNQDCLWIGNSWKPINRGWEAGGVKTAWAKDGVFRRCVFWRNGGPGLWLDIHVRNVLITECAFLENEKSGLFIEISRDIMVVRNLSARNGVGWVGKVTGPDWSCGGIQIAESQNCLVTLNTCVENKDGITFREQGPRTLNTEDMGEVRYFNKGNVVTRNVCAFNEGYQLGLWYDNGFFGWHPAEKQKFKTEAAYAAFLKTIPDKIYDPTKQGMTIDQNLYFAAKGQGLILYGTPWRPKHQTFKELATFTAKTGFDKQSRIANPLFSEPDNTDYSFKPNSPALKMQAGWKDTTGNLSEWLDNMLPEFRREFECKNDSWQGKVAEAVFSRRDISVEREIPFRFLRLVQRAEKDFSPYDEMSLPASRLTFRLQGNDFEVQAVNCVTQSQLRGVSLAAKPLMSVPSGARFQFGGLIGERIKANQENWLLSAPRANPAMLQMFRDRDRKPRRALVPWAGEFPGKYLISAVQGYRLTRDKRLRDFVEKFVHDLIAVQDADGYLGPHPKNERLTGKTHDGHALWDLWGHYHCMLGLLLWSQETGDKAALNAACKTADLMCNRFLDTNERAISAGAEEMNLAVSHALCLLYEATGNERYLSLVREIERDWETPPAGDYVRTALNGVEFFKTPKPRWESLHDVQAIAELYFITGDERYRKAFTHIYQSIRRFDRHNTGAFSSGEGAVGNPYDPRAIETCCVIAWAAVCLDALRMTGDSTVADEIELATFNAILGAQHPSGRWWTYNTPMDGVRRASAHDIVFQAHQGSPELNCCSVNAPRGIGMLSEWAFMLTDDGVAVNFYGPCSVQLPLANGAKLTLTQTTDYPRDGKVTITLGLAKPQQLALRLRIPAWSRTTKVTVNGRGINDVRTGSYLVINRMWKSGDTVRLTFDLSLHIWVGEREAANRVSIYRGPILLTYDQRFNAMDPDDVPPLDAGWSPELVQAIPQQVEASVLLPWLLLRFRTADGRELRLCDFASAGAAGTHYRSWLPMRGLEKLPPERQSPFASRLKME